MIKTQFIRALCIQQNTDKHTQTHTRASTVCSWVYKYTMHACIRVYRMNVCMLTKKFAIGWCAYNMAEECAVSLVGVHVCAWGGVVHIAARCAFTFACVGIRTVCQTETTIAVAVDMHFGNRNVSFALCSACQPNFYRGHYPAQNHFPLDHWTWSFGLLLPPRQINLVDEHRRATNSRKSLARVKTKQNKKNTATKKHMPSRETIYAPHFLEKNKNISSGECFQFILKISPFFSVFGSIKLVCIWRCNRRLWWSLRLHYLYVWATAVRKCTKYKWIISGDPCALVTSYT